MKIPKIQYHASQIGEIISSELCPSHQKNFCYFNYLNQTLLCETCLQQCYLSNPYYIFNMPQQNIEIYHEDQSNNFNKSQNVAQKENEISLQTSCFPKQKFQQDKQQQCSKIRQIGMENKDQMSSFEQKNSNDVNKQFQNKKNNQNFTQAEQRKYFRNLNWFQNVRQYDQITELRKQVQYELNKSDGDKEKYKNIAEKVFNQHKMNKFETKIHQKYKFSKICNIKQYPLYSNQQQSPYQHYTQQQQQLYDQQKQQQQIDLNSQTINQQKQVNTYEISIQPKNEFKIINEKTKNYSDINLSLEYNSNLQVQKSKLLEQQINIKVKREDSNENISDIIDQKRKFNEQIENIVINKLNINDCKDKQNQTFCYVNKDESCNFQENKNLKGCQSFKKNNNNQQLFNINETKQEFNQKLEEQEVSNFREFQQLNKSKKINKQKQLNPHFSHPNQINKNLNVTSQHKSQKEQKSNLRTSHSKLNSDQQANQQTLLICNLDETIDEQNQKSIGELKKETNVDSQSNGFSSSTQESLNQSINNRIEQKQLKENHKNNQNKIIQHQNKSHKYNNKSITKLQKTKYSTQNICYKKRLIKNRNKRISKRKK